MPLVMSRTIPPLPMQNVTPSRERKNTRPAIMTRRQPPSSITMNWSSCASCRNVSAPHPTPRWAAMISLYLSVRRNVRQPAVCVVAKHEAKPMTCWHRPDPMVGTMPIQETLQKKTAKRPVTGKVRLVTRNRKRQMPMTQMRRKRKPL